MSYSIYDVKDYSDIAKPSSVLDAPNMIFDSPGFMTRPEMHNRQNQPGEGEPFYDYYNIDESIRKYLLDEYHQTYSPNTLLDDSNRGIFVNGMKDASRRIISQYRLEHTDHKHCSHVHPKNHSKVAISLSDLSRATSSFSKKYQGGCYGMLVDKNIDEGLFRYHVVCHESWSSKGGHIVTVHLNPSKKQTKILDMDVEISCSCPFWQYWGPDYHAFMKDYLYEEAGGAPFSDLTLPMEHKKNNLICKHVAVIQKLFQRFARRYEKRVYDKISDILSNIRLETVPDLLYYVEQILDLVSPATKSALRAPYKALKADPKRQGLRTRLVKVLEDKLPNEKERVVKDLEKIQKDFEKEKSRRPRRRKTK